MRCAVAVGGPPGEIGSFHGLAAAAALDRGGIHEPQVVVPGRASSSERRNDVLKHLARVTESFVVAGTIRQVGEPGAQVGVHVSDEAGLGREPEQGLQHGQGEEFGVGELRGDPDRRPFDHCGCSMRRSSMVT